MMLLFVVASEMTLTRAFFLRVASSENSSLKICQNLPQNQLHLKPLKIALHSFNTTFL